MPSARPLTDERHLRRSVRLAQAETLLAHEPGGHWQPCAAEMQLLQDFVDGGTGFLRARTNLRAWRSCPFFRWYRARLAAGHSCLLSAHPARHG